MPVNIIQVISNLDQAAANQKQNVPIIALKTTMTVNVKSTLNNMVLKGPEGVQPMRHAAPIAPKIIKMPSVLSIVQPSAFRVQGDVAIPPHVPATVPPITKIQSVPSIANNTIVVLKDLGGVLIKPLVPLIVKQIMIALNALNIVASIKSNMNNKKSSMSNSMRSRVGNMSSKGKLLSRSVVDSTNNKPLLQGCKE